MIVGNKVDKVRLSKLSGSFSCAEPASLCSRSSGPSGAGYRRPNDPDAHWPPSTPAGVLAHRLDRGGPCVRRVARPALALHGVLGQEGRRRRERRRGHLWAGRRQGEPRSLALRRQRSQLCATSRRSDPLGHTLRLCDLADAASPSSCRSSSALRSTRARRRPPVVPQPAVRRAGGNRAAQAGRRGLSPAARARSASTTRCRARAGALAEAGMRALARRARACRRASSSSSSLFPFPFHLPFPFPCTTLVPFYAH